MTRRLHLHVDRLVVEGSLDRRAFERALREALADVGPARAVSAVPALRIEVNAAGTRNLSATIGAAIGRSLGAHASGAAERRRK